MILRAHRRFKQGDENNMGRQEPKEVKIYTSEEVRNTIIPIVECHFCKNDMNEYDFYYNKEHDIITRKFRSKCYDCLKRDYWNRKEYLQQMTDKIKGD